MTDSLPDMKSIIGRVAAGEHLDVDSARRAFDIMMSGDATPAQMGAFLMGLRVRGETVDELTGGVMTMREKMTRIDAPAGAVDVVGTGGDGAGTYNISTAAGLVVAGAGVPVAKHGNRAASSKSGAADVLTALGIRIDCDFSLVRKALWEAGMCFMFAQRHHGAMRHVGATRVELGMRTIFNMLGPLSNPAGVTRQLVGVFSRHWVEPLAHVLANLKAEHVWVVHGEDGLDEMTTTGPTHVAELKDGRVRTFIIEPADAGLPVADPASLRGGDAETNALALSAVLDGHESPYRDIVLMNAAATLVTAGKASDIRAGVALARKSIDSGQARAVLERVITITNETVPGQ
jgi:anthranilate phosphoribosyltransferase